MKWSQSCEGAGLRALSLLNVCYGQEQYTRVPEGNEVTEAATFSIDLRDIGRDA